MLKNYIKIYKQAVDYCKIINNIDCNNSLTINSVSMKLFFEYKFKRRLIESLYILRNYRLFNLSDMLVNIFMPRKGKQIVFCFEMISALNAHLVGSDDECRVFLDNAWLMLSSLRKTNRREYADHLEEWFDLRNYYASLNKIFI